MKDQLGTKEEDILDLKLEHAKDKYEERDEDDRLEHPSITFDVSLEHQALTQPELNYFCRLYIRFPRWQVLI